MILLFRFTVNPKTGEIKLGEKLDFETEPFLSLMFVATDGGGKKTAVPFRVTVIDYNDQGPKFEVDNYETSVTESETVLSPPITIKVSAQIDGHYNDHGPKFKVDNYDTFTESKTFVRLVLTIKVKALFLLKKDFHLNMMIRI